MMSMVVDSRVRKEVRWGGVTYCRPHRDQVDSELTGHAAEAHVGYEIEC